MVLNRYYILKGWREASRCEVVAVRKVSPGIVENRLAANAGVPLD